MLDRRVLEQRSVLRIGGFAFDVRSSPLPFDEGLDPAYDGFRAEGPDPADHVVEVDLQPGDAAPPAGARQLCDGGPSWSAYALPDGSFAIASAPPASGPVWCARFDRGLTRVELRFSPVLWNEGRFYSPLRYPLDQLLMMHGLAGRSGAVVHCALIAVGDRAVICPGVSGAGKTTLTRELAGAADIDVLSDDRAVVRREAGGWMAYGTPWPGEGGFAQNRALPLAAVGFLQRGPAAALPLSSVAALKRIVRVASVPWYDRESGPAVFDALAALCTEVPTFSLAFARDGAVAHALRTMAGADPAD